MRRSIARPALAAASALLTVTVLAACRSDDNPETAGQVTTAVAMGDNLLSRLQKAGMRFETLS